jgi:hypothetical protein
MGKMPMSPGMNNKAGPMFRRAFPGIASAATVGCADNHTVPGTRGAGRFAFETGIG